MAERSAELRQKLSSTPIRATLGLAKHFALSKNLVMNAAVFGCSSDYAF
jgi:hypothetical protein